MGVERVSARATLLVMAATVLLAVGVAGCRATSGVHRPMSQPARARAFVDTFDRILIAGFLADDVSDRGRVLDVNEETARLLRMTLRSQGGLDVIEAQPLELREVDSNGAIAEDAIFGDMAFWRRLGEEYRGPLIVTGVVAFKAIGSQYEERTAGRRSVWVRRAAFSLRLRLIFIDGRTGQVLDSVLFEPVSGQATDARMSALGLYFGLMDRLRPSVLESLGRQNRVTPYRNRR